MKIGSWAEGKSCSVITHHSHQVKNANGVDKALRERATRVKSLKAYLNPATVALMLSMLATGCASTSNYQTVNNPLELSDRNNVSIDRSADDIHKNIKRNVTPGYQIEEGSDTLTFIDVNDPNLEYIIQNADVKVLPNFNEKIHKLLSESIDNPDDMLRDSLIVNTQKMRDEKIASALGSNSNKLGKLCFFQASTNDKELVYNDQVAISFSSNEAKIAALGHEVTHCMDLRNLSQSPYHKSYKEVLADFSGAILVASHTGNWDHLEHSSDVARVVDVYDGHHNTSRALNYFKDHVDLKDVSALSLTEAFNFAKEFIDNDMPFAQMHEADAHYMNLNKGYENIASKDFDELTEDDFNKFSFHDESIGIPDHSQNKKLFDEYGLKRIEKYLNHLNYKSLEKEEDFSYSLLYMMAKHGHAFGNDQLVEMAKQEYQRFNSEGYVNINGIAEALNLDVDFESKKRFEANNSKIEHIVQRFEASLSGMGQDLKSIDHSQNLLQNTLNMQQFMSKLNIAHELKEPSKGMGR